MSADEPTHVSLSQSLLSSAHWHAKYAFETRESESPDQRLASCISIGAAAELLLKHLLTLHSPILLSPLNAGHAPGIASRKAFARDRNGPHLADVRSCTAEDAFRMVREIVGRCPLRQDEFKLMYDIRNAAAHLAVLPLASQLEAAVYSAVKMFERAPLEDNPWAHEFLRDPSIATFAENYEQQRIALTMRKVEHAKETFKSLSASEMSQSRKEAQYAFLDRQAEATFGPDPAHWTYFFPNVQERKCLACRQEALLLCGADGTHVDESGRETDDFDDENLGVMLTAVAYACPNCGLRLTPSELYALADEENGWASNLVEPSFMRTDEYVAVSDPYVVSILKNY